MQIINDGNGGNLSEDSRRQLARMLMITGWIGAVALVCLIAVGTIAPVYTPVSVLLTGVAVAATNVQSRVRMTQTIGDVFEVGLRAATSLQASVASTACIIETDLQGIIQSTERAEAIGWDPAKLINQAADAVIPDRYLRAWQSDFRKLQLSGDTRSLSSSASMQVRAQDGSERVCRMSLARLGDTYIATFVPIGTEDGAVTAETILEG